MADPTYTPPKVWSVDTESGGRFANINRPTAGAREEKDLPVGENPFQLYSLATPNGVKVTIMLEELLELGHKGAEYDAYTVNIGQGEQFTTLRCQPAFLAPQRRQREDARQECAARERGERHVVEAERSEADRVGAASASPPLVLRH